MKGENACADSIRCWQDMPVKPQDIEHERDRGRVTNQYWIGYFPRDSTASASTIFVDFSHLNSRTSISGLEVRQLANVGSVCLIKVMGNQPTYKWLISE